MKKHKDLFIILNFVIPLLVGTVIYYFISSDVFFVKFIDNIIGKGIHFTSLVNTNFLIRFIRFYVLDMLWGYALVFALYFIIGNDAAKLWKILFIAFVFSCAVELFQIASFSTGTFDIADIAFEFLAEVLAVFIIKILMRRLKR